MAATAKMKSMADEVMVPAYSEKKKKEIQYPEFSITSDQVEDIEEMKLDDEVMLIAKCTVKELRQGKDWNDKTGFRATLCIKEAAVKPMEGKKSNAKSIEDAYYESVKESKK